MATLFQVLKEEKQRNHGNGVVIVTKSGQKYSGSLNKWDEASDQTIRLASGKMYYHIPLCEIESVGTY